MEAWIFKRRVATRRSVARGLAALALAAVILSALAISTASRADARTGPCAVAKSLKRAGERAAARKTLVAGLRRNPRLVCAIKGLTRLEAFTADAQAGPCAVAKSLKKAGERDAASKTLVGGLRLNPRLVCAIKALRRLTAGHAEASTIPVQFAAGMTTVVSVGAALLVFLSGRLFTRKRKWCWDTFWHQSAVMLGGVYVASCAALAWNTWKKAVGNPDLLFHWHLESWMSIVFVPPIIFGGISVLIGLSYPCWKLQNAEATTDPPAWRATEAL
jgi:hypothetical protein